MRTRKQCSQWQPYGILPLLPPTNKVWGKVIFSEACVKNSVHRGACMARGVCGWGACMPSGVCGQGACMAGGHVCLGACGQGGACHAQPPQPDTMRYGWSMSERYASYWNAFLFHIISQNLLLNSFHHM